MDEFEPCLKKKKNIFTKEFISKYLYIFVIGIFLLLGVSYGLTFFVQNRSIATGSFVALGLDISFSNRGINASDLTPSENDSVGMLEFVKTLTISNNEAADGNVIVRLNRTSGLNLSDMRYSLKINNVIKEVGDVPTNGEMLSSSIFSGETLNIEVRLWPKSDYSGSETTFVGELEGDIRYLGIVANSYDNLNNAYVYFNCSGNTCEIWRIVKVENGRLVLTREEDLVGASSRVDSGRYNPNLTFNDNSMITSVSTDNKNVYLAKTVKIVGGSGTALDPYTLANNEYSENDNKIIGIITYKEEDRTTVIGTQPIYYGRTNYVSRQTTNPETEDWIGDNNNTYMYGSVIEAQGDINLYICSKEEYQIFYSGNGATLLANNDLLLKYDGLYHNGTTIIDLSQRGRNKPTTNVTFTNDYMQFNGTSSWVNLGEMNYDYMTLEVTFMIDEFTQEAQEHIISSQESGGAKICIINNSTTDHRIRAVFYINGDNRYIDYNDLEIGKKYHVAATYDGVDMIMYVNGIEVGRNEISGYTIVAPTSGTPTVLGVDPNSTGSQNRYFFKGKIYNVAIYSTALSAGQVELDAGMFITKNSMYGQLPTPQRHGYQFSGWYTAPTGGTQITSSTVFTGNSDTTIYARWEPSYHIFYSGNGSTQLNNGNLIAKYDSLYHNGSTLTDISGKNKNGTASNVTFTNDYMQFNGTSSWVNLGEMNYDYMTVEATFMVDTFIESGMQIILSNIETAGVQIYIYNTNGEHRINSLFYINGEAKYLLYHNVEVGKKYHVVTTYDGTNYIMYVNGFEVGRQVCSGYTITAPASGTPMVLGVDPTTTGSQNRRYFTGKIYNAAIYSSALSAEQVALDAGKILSNNDTYGELPTPQRYGYSFDGWYTAASGGTEITSSTVFTGNSDTTIYARWVDDLSPTITLSPNSSTSNGTTKNVTVTLADAGSGLASGASVKYGWSTSNTTAPTSYTTASLSYSAGAKSTTFTATGTFDSGTRYLWVVPTTLEDVNGNSQTQNKVSGVFNFASSDTTAPNITCKVNSSGTDGVTVTVTASDSESGLSVDPSVSHANIVSTRTYTATNGVGLSSSCTVTVKKWSRYDKKRYACTKGTWGSGSSSYVTSCTSISQSSANSSNSNTYVKCQTVHDSACGCGNAASGCCKLKTTYSRTGCSTYSSSGTTISTGLSSCDASSNKNYKYTCTKYYTYTGSVS